MIQAWMLEAHHHHDADRSMTFNDLDNPDDRALVAFLTCQRVDDPRHECGLVPGVAVCVPFNIVLGDE